jgi:hypothetical protein
VLIELIPVRLIKPPVEEPPFGKFDCVIVRAVPVGFTVKFAPATTSKFPPSPTLLDVFSEAPTALRTEPPAMIDRSLPLVAETFDVIVKLPVLENNGSPVTFDTPSKKSFDVALMCADPAVSFTTPVMFVPFTVNALFPAFRLSVCDRSSPLFIATPPALLTLIA